MINSAFLVYLELRCNGWASGIPARETKTRVESEAANNTNLRVINIIYTIKSFDLRLRNLNTHHDFYGLHTHTLQGDPTSNPPSHEN